MSTTISKGKFFRVSVTVDDARLKAMRRAPELAQEALETGAEYWHTGILPDHFKKDAHSKYGYAGRSRNYLANRGKGSKPDLVFSGSLRRDLLARSALKAQGKTGVELKLTARVLNFAPTLPENSDDLYVKHKRGRGYPNLKREIKTVLEDEREAVAQVICNRLEKTMGPTN